MFTRRIDQLQSSSLFIGRAFWNCRLYRQYQMTQIGCEKWNAKFIHNWYLFCLYRSWMYPPCPHRWLASRRSKPTDDNSGWRRQFRKFKFDLILKDYYFVNIEMYFNFEIFLETSSLYIVGGKTTQTVTKVLEASRQ